MFELLIVLILAPFVSGICDAVYSFCREKNFKNPFSLYKNLFVSLKTSHAQNEFSPFSALALSAAVIAAFILFNISTNLDYIIFLAFMLANMFAISFFDKNFCKNKIIGCSVYITVMTTLYAYMNNPVFEALSEVKGVNTFMPAILSLVFLLIGSYFYRPEPCEINGVDKAFLIYSQSLCLTLFIALTGLLFYSLNLVVFAVNLIAGAAFTGIIYFADEKIPYLRNTLAIAAALLFVAPALLAYWQ